MKKSDDLSALVEGLASLRKEVREIRDSVHAGMKLVFSNQEMMSMLGVSSSTLKSWRDDGLIGYTQLGKIYLYSREDVLLFLREHHRESLRKRNDNSISSRGTC